jgi:hypothetical protein
MDWVFGGFLAASVVHMVEEYFYPGGFMGLMKRFNPRFARFVTVPMAVVINGLQLLLCLIAVVVGRKLPIFSMSVAGLLFFNALMHVGGCVRTRGYAPGVITGVLFYLPLSIYAYTLFLSSSLLTWAGVIITGVLGLIYQAIPIGYLAFASAANKNIKV